ncbi:hypothetical protein SNE40_000387 [Patella caerulea]|uniref:Uncharacterized protein n=1 Tax=Patella caerulea TaxID=87958 RepID=A0AAN8Q268_PATCE
MESKLRSDDVMKELLGMQYKEESVFITTSKLPSGKHIIGRMLALCKVPEKGVAQMSRNDASKVVAHEVRADWINKNVYPISEKAIARRLCDDYETFRDFRKTERRTTKKSDIWYKKAANFNRRMVDNAYDVRNLDKQYEKLMEGEFGVMMTREDDEFYQDNCHGPYVATCTATVPKNWLKQKRRVEGRMKSEELKRRDMENEWILQRELDSIELMDCIKQNCEQTDPTFNPIESYRNDLMSSPPITRTSPCHNNPRFPQVMIRTGHRKINESLMRCLVNCLSKYKVTTNDLIGITLQLANTVFGQHWINSCSTDTDSDDASDDETEEEIYSTKRKRNAADRSFTMPSRSCISSYLEDASYMNLEMVAKKMAEKVEEVVTIGLDDTTKAAGHKFFDVKTDHIVISGPEGKECFTTGYMENISHSGKDGAEAYTCKLQSLAILAGTTVDEMKEHVDFWISDRAQDCKKLLQHLDIQPERTLKCCAHLILGVDSAIDKVFRDTETKIGLDKLINCNNILKSASSSVFTVGLIAISKLLSPSHAAHSVSLYSEFKDWLKQKHERHDFKGFVSNRFGRIAELAKTYLLSKNILTP